MYSLLAAMLLMAPANAPKVNAPKADAPKVEATKLAPRPLEDVLAAKEKPGGEQTIMVTAHVLVHDPNGKKGMSVKFVDVEGSPNVNVKKWDPKLSQLKPETTILVTGELHFGPVSGGTASLRYKVRETTGKKYNDHRHWRTDKAIYIVNPTFEVVDAGKDEKKDEEKPAKG